MIAMSVIFWKSIKRHEEGAKVKIRYLIRIAKKAEYHGNLSKCLLTLDMIKLNLKKAEREYMEVKKKAWEYRESFMLIEEAEEKTKQNNHQRN